MCIGGVLFSGFIGHVMGYMKPKITKNLDTFNIHLGVLERKKTVFFSKKWDIFSNFNCNFHLQLQLQMLRWYDMFLLHFLSSTKVSLAYFAQFRMVPEIRIFKEGRSRGGPKGGPKGLYNDKLNMEYR